MHRSRDGVLVTNCCRLPRRMRADRSFFRRRCNRSPKHPAKSSDRHRDLLGFPWLGTLVADGPDRQKIHLLLPKTPGLIRLRRESILTGGPTDTMRSWHVEPLRGLDLRSRPNEQHGSAPCIQEHSGGARGGHLAGASAPGALISGYSYHQFDAGSVNLSISSSFALLTYNQPFPLSV